MNYFEPDVSRGIAVRTAMDGALWESAVQEIVDRVGPQLRESWGDNVAAPRTCFLDYAAYFDLSMTPPNMYRIPDSVQEAAVRRLSAMLADPSRSDGPSPDPIRITNYSEDYYDAAQLAAMSRWWDIEPSNRMSLIAASQTEWLTVKALADEALRRLESAAPELYGETLAIIRDLVVAKPDQSSKINYSGASSFALWGAITVNAEVHHNWIQMYRQIVHEAGHNLLFGIAREEPLVLNEPGDRTASPIRADPRPIDGVFHAAYVSAREAFALEALLIDHDERNCLSVTEAEIISDLLRLSVLAFTDCIATLRGGEARLSKFGIKVLQDCEEYVQSNFAVEPG